MSDKVDFNDLIKDHVGKHTMIMKPTPSAVRRMKMEENNFDKNFKRMQKIVITIFCVTILGIVGSWAVAGYVAVRLGPKALNAAENLLDKAN